MKRLISISLIVLIALCCAGRGTNEIHFSMGTASNFDGNTLLVENETVLIPRSKEMIEDSQLVFHPNDEGKYEDIRLFYRGSNIRSVTVSGKESTVYYENLDTVTDMVDVFRFYYPVEEADEDFDAEADFTARWNSGEFDEIRNVYFNGLNVEEINRIRRDQSKKSVISHLL